MTKRRTCRPIPLDPELSASDLELYSFATGSDPPTGVPEWHRRWSTPHGASENTQEIIDRFGCDVLRRFSEELFNANKPIGILTSRRATTQQSWTNWLVLRRASCPTDSLSVTEILKAEPGDFCFLHEPSLSLPVDGHSLTLVQRFFAAFGGLRDTAPFFGSDYFWEYPGKMTRRAITSRVHKQPLWIDSDAIHTRGNCDYLLLSAICPLSRSD